METTEEHVARVRKSFLEDCELHLTAVTSPCRSSSARAHIDYCATATVSLATTQTRSHCEACTPPTLGSPPAGLLLPASLPESSFIVSSSADAYAPREADYEFHLKECCDIINTVKDSVLQPNTYMYVLYKDYGLMWSR